MGRIKVLVIDDSAFYRQAIAGIIKRDPRFEVIGTVPNGSEAIRFISQSRPDVITLDLEMPTMDGFTFLRWLMANAPVPVVMISSQSEGQNVLKALELGAVDFLIKPSQRATLEIRNLESELISKIETAALISPGKLRLKYELNFKKETAAPSVSKSSQGPNTVRVVAIGASTGGPPAVQSIITKLPKDFPAAVVVAQHMPAGFTLYFAERLDKSSNIPVKEGAVGDPLEAGKVFISPGGHHMMFRPSRSGVEVVLKSRTEADKYTPSVDQMMISAAEIYGPGVLGVILTGMGSDGKLGIKTIKEKGGTTFAESEETSVVFGMPKEAIGLGVIDKVLPLHKIADEVIKRCSS